MFNIVVAQLNLRIGDFSGNCAKILQVCRNAPAGSLVVTSELAVCGYPADDLLLREDFLKASDEALSYLLGAIEGVTLIVGHPQLTSDGLFNTASVIRDKKVIASYHKMVLPNHGVFDEKRYFSEGNQALLFSHDGHQVGLLICEDIWQKKPIQLSIQGGATILICLNASPFESNKLRQRQQLLQKWSKEISLPIVYVNAVGGQDELIFDGGSLVLNQQGEIVRQLPCFSEAVMTVSHFTPSISCSQPFSEVEEMYHALMIGLYDYVHKNGFTGVLLGLSGGIDSALSLAIATDTLGAERVHALMLYSPFTSNDSLEDARQMAETLRIRYTECDILPSMHVIQEALDPLFLDKTAGVTQENIQARIRAVLLMAVSNQFGNLLITTGNKSELAVGYCTLYGDMAGGFALLKDILKTEVYALSHYRNSISHVIPSRVLSRAPTAELRENQQDSDHLPDYAILDKIIDAYVLKNLCLSDIVALGHDIDTVARVIKLIDMNEYKRKQSAVGPRVSRRAFGKDWRMPISH